MHTPPHRKQFNWHVNVCLDMNYTPLIMYRKSWGFWECVFKCALYQTNTMSLKYSSVSHLSVNPTSQYMLTFSLVHQWFSAWSLSILFWKTKFEASYSCYLPPNEGTVGFSLNMAAASKAFLLLVLLYLAETLYCAEYYVKADPSTTCPITAGPCLTLSEYLQDSTTYFTSGSNFTLLQGEHHLNETVALSGVTGITFRGEDTETTTISINTGGIMWNNSQDNSLKIKYTKVEQKLHILPWYSKIPHCFAGQQSLSCVEVTEHWWYAGPPTPKQWNNMKTAVVGDMGYFMANTATVNVYRVHIPTLRSCITPETSSGTDRQIWNEIRRLQLFQSTPLSLSRYGSLLAVVGWCMLMLWLPSTWQRHMGIGDLPSPCYKCTCISYRQGSVCGWRRGWRTTIEESGCCTDTLKIRYCENLSCTFAHAFTTS